MSWDKVFEPIEGPDGISFDTLRDAGGVYIDQMPDDVKTLPEWDAAASALLVVVEHNGPVSFAQMGMLMALNRDKSPAAPREKKPELKPRPADRMEASVGVGTLYGVSCVPQVL